MMSLGKQFIGSFEGLFIEIFQHFSKHLSASSLRVIQEHQYHVHCMLHMKLESEDNVN